MKLIDLLLSFIFVSYVQCEYWEDILDKLEENDKSEEDDSSEEMLLNPVLEIKNGNSEEDKSLPILKECKDSCLFEAKKKTIIDKVSKTSVGEACMQGCQEQHKSLLELKKFYQNTSPDLLLGSAIDNCWDGCSGVTDGQTFCISGCDKMRNIQRKLIKIGQMATQDEMEKKENPHDSLNNLQKDNVIKNVESFKEVEDEGKTWTYLLLSPGQDCLDAVVTYMSMMNMMDNMFREMDKSTNDQSMGWRGDRRQLNLPQYPARTAALTDDNDYYSKYYDKVSNSLGQIKKKVQDTVSSPGFKEFFFFVLFCISGIMLLQTTLIILLGNKETHQPVDHFYLPPAGALPPKLPSYDECMKDSQKLCVGLTQQEDMCKINLSLPVVSLPLVKENENEDVLEDADLKQDDNVQKA